MLDFLGQLLGADMQKKHDENMARNSISWRVEDAKRSGISPLAALGVQGFNASDVSSGMGSAIGRDVDRMTGRQLTKEKLKQERIKTQMMSKERDILFGGTNKQDVTGMKRPPTVVEPNRVPGQSLPRNTVKPMGYDNKGRPYYNMTIGPGGQKRYHYSPSSGEDYEQEFGDVGAINQFENWMWDFFRNLHRGDYDQLNPTEGDFAN